MKILRSTNQAFLTRTSEIKSRMSPVQGAGGAPAVRIQIAKELRALRFVTMVNSFRPAEAVDPSVERYAMDREVVKECMKKVIKDLNGNLRSKRSFCHPYRP
ncbi:hypothetical protein OSTOST_07068 [Ostertagia ostertagi]